MKPGPIEPNALGFAILERLTRQEAFLRAGEPA